MGIQVIEYTIIYYTFDKSINRVNDYLNNQNNGKNRNGDGAAC